MGLVITAASREKYEEEEVIRVAVKGQTHSTFAGPRPPRDCEIFEISPNKRIGKNVY